MNFHRALIAPLLLICLGIATPNVMAQTTTITNLQSPTSATLQNGVADVKVTFTVSFSDLPSGDSLGFGVLYQGTKTYALGTVSSSPDSCLSLTGTPLVNSTYCYILTPQPGSGTESASFTITLNSTQTYNLRIIAMIGNKSKLVNTSLSTADFTITVTK